MNKLEYSKEDIIEMQEDIEWWTNRFNAVQRGYENLQQRIDKAIEYISDYEDYCNEKECYCTPKYFETLLEILGEKENGKE